MTTYSIQELSQMTGLPASTLRYYEDLGLLGEVPKNASGHREYQEKHLHRMRFLLLLKNTGMPLTGMQAFAELDEGGYTTVPERILLLESHRLNLEDKIGELLSQLNYLGEKIKYYQGVCEKYGLPDPLNTAEADQQVV
ncbi:MerR family transcriptional regulator [Deinococcus cellulosilyticus]|uniref:HTH merR-type domain-containing protein n=1 Tax=Deinococcus cellulosilyticus (strain DSM 18568 / NBRC 106333 / KACC 11606 / 5516J-15) TaxID=1223518 RepID=A0A511NAN3_DEIC1|nr:MerR family transcriptional regulator [Deinococcus cellulosilyticus]GEM49421.1 hypothetical protein DC3_50560 [Deinococcus cellulosilyticus NBRC 106333 = KACC 11606]